MPIKIPKFGTPPHPHQEGPDGPLTAEFRRRINDLRSRRRLTLADIGSEFGVSGPTMSNLLRERNPGRVRTIHLQRFVEALERLEREAGMPIQAASSEDSNEQPTQHASMEELIRVAHKNGFAVTFTPLPRRSDEA